MDGMTTEELRQWLEARGFGEDVTAAFVGKTLHPF